MLLLLAILPLVVATISLRDGCPVRPIELPAEVEVNSGNSSEIKCTLHFTLPAGTVPEMYKFGYNVTRTLAQREPYWCFLLSTGSQIWYRKCAGLPPESGRKPINGSNMTVETNVLFPEIRGTTLGVLILWPEIPPNIPLIAGVAVGVPLFLIILGGVLMAYRRRLSELRRQRRLAKKIRYIQTKQKEAAELENQTNLSSDTTVDLERDDKKSQLENLNTELDQLIVQLTEKDIGSIPLSGPLAFLNQKQDMEPHGNNLNLSDWIRQTRLARQMPHIQTKQKQAADLEMQMQTAAQITKEKKTELDKLNTELDEFVMTLSEKDMGSIPPSGPLAFMKREKVMKPRNGRKEHLDLLDWITERRRAKKLWDIRAKQKEESNVSLDTTAVEKTQLENLKKELDLLVMNLNEEDIAALSEYQYRIRWMVGRFGQYDECLQFSEWIRQRRLEIKRLEYSDKMEKQTMELVSMVGEENIESFPVSEWVALSKVERKIREIQSKEILIKANNPEGSDLPSEDDPHPITGSKKLPLDALNRELAQLVTELRREVTESLPPAVLSKAEEIIIRHTRDARRRLEDLRFAAAALH